MIHVTVQSGINEARHNLDLYVVNKTTPSLFGRSWLRYIQIDWKEVHTLHTVKPVNDRVNNLVKKYKHVFNEEVGLVTGMKENATPN